MRVGKAIKARHIDVDVMFALFHPAWAGFALGVARGE